TSGAEEGEGCVGGRGREGRLSQPAALPGARPKRHRADDARTEKRSCKKRKIESGTEMPLLRSVPLCRQGRGGKKRKGVSEEKGGRGTHEGRSGTCRARVAPPLHLSGAALFRGSVRWRPWRSRDEL
ncbi:unnamed protein product, partial [Ixodes pacificus]